MIKELFTNFSLKIFLLKIVSIKSKLNINIHQEIYYKYNNIRIKFMVFMIMGFYLILILKMTKL